MRATISFECAPSKVGYGCVRVSNLPSSLIALLRESEAAAGLLPSLFRVQVVDAGMHSDDMLPDVCGQHEVFHDAVQFTPLFPFDSGVRFRATFDPLLLGHPELTEILALQFSPPREAAVSRAEVVRVFPSGGELPENVLRFYVSFSSPMQRGWACEHVGLLDEDGEPAADTLYRTPVELWDRSMRCLTVLLDPGRLKRGVGPNRELGPPLKPGRRYSLMIGDGILDSLGQQLSASYRKQFTVTEAVRAPITIDHWRLLPPSVGSYDSLTLAFPRALDWALLWNAVTVVHEDGSLVAGWVSVEEDETRWCFSPALPWTAGAYVLQVDPTLEDVCGNSLRGAFDTPLSPNKKNAESFRSTLTFRLS